MTFDYSTYLPCWRPPRGLIGHDLPWRLLDLLSWTARRSSDIRRISLEGEVDPSFAALLLLAVQRI